MHPVSRPTSIRDIWGPQYKRDVGILERSSVGSPRWSKDWSTSAVRTGWESLEKRRGSGCVLSMSLKVTEGGWWRGQSQAVVSGAQGQARRPRAQPRWVLGTLLVQGLGPGGLQRCLPASALPWLWESDQTSHACSNLWHGRNYFWLTLFHTHRFLS